MQFEAVTATLEQANIPMQELFLNADAGFDPKDFRKSCEKKEIHANICFNKRNGSADRDEYFDQELYRYSLPLSAPMPGWISYRSLLNRFDTTVASWLGFNYLSFKVIALKKFKKKKLEKV